MAPTAPYLINLYREFPFQEGRLADILTRVQGRAEELPPDAWPRSFRVHLACMVSLAATALLPKGCNRLGFAYNANAPRSGKTLLLQSAICPIYGWTSGRPWPVSGQGKNQSDEAELRKSLDAIAMEGAPYAFFDNIRCQVESQSLEGFMTMPMWTGRIMGTQKTFTAPVASTILLTGNDLKLSVDMTERFLFCDLFVEEAEAQSRPIEFVIEQPWIMEHREEIFQAVLGLIHHWDAMGRPNPPNRVRRGFETFGNIIGGIISAAGFGDLFEKRPDSESSGNSADQDIRRLCHLIVETMHETPGKDGLDTLLSAPVPEQSFVFDELVQLSYREGLFQYFLEGKEAFDNVLNINKIHLNQKGAAMFGACLKRYAPESKGRTWELPHNSRIKLRCEGKGHRRKYIATLHLTKRGRLHQLIERDLLPHHLGQGTLDTYLESQGMPVIAGCQEPDLENILHNWPSIKHSLTA